MILVTLLLKAQGEPFACGLRSGMQIHFSPKGAIVEERDRIILGSEPWFSQSGTNLLLLLGVLPLMSTLPGIWTGYQTVY